MKYKDNLGGLLSINNKNTFSPVEKAQVGRVYGVITTENTPTKKQFEKFGGFNAVGTVFYRNYNESINLIGDISDDFFDQCETAKPISPDTPYPLIDELILIEELLPSASTQLLSTSIRKYYLGIIGVWNSIQHNAQPAGNKYNFKTFNAVEDIKSLLLFEGDKVFLGRKGNSIRFGSTVKDKSDVNEWSNGPGTDGDPITIISDGHKTDPNIPYHIEQINKEFSSIYLTSTQRIPLITDRTDILNPLTNPTKVSDYFRSQVMINADRIVINSKKDDLLLFATTNIEINTNYIVNINAKERTHINSPRIFFGTNKDGTLPDEPLVLGNQMVDFMSQLIEKLSIFCSELQSVKSTPEGTDIIQIQAAAKVLNGFLLKSLKPEKLEKLVSKYNYTK